MAGQAGRACAVRSALALALAVAGYAPGARAVSAFEDQLQAHGFAEMQLRALDSEFAEEIDLAQWYNVLNIEIETDIFPDGWGPFNLLQTFVRVEGRFDCIYVEGCGMFPSVSTWGDDSNALPKRLRTAIDENYGGVVEVNDSANPPGSKVRRIPPGPRDPTGFVVYEEVANTVIERTCAAGVPTPPGMPFGECINNRSSFSRVVFRRGFPGLDTLFRRPGADNEIGASPDFGQTPPGDPNDAATRDELVPFFRSLAPANDDPAVYALAPVIDWKFTFVHRKGAGGGANSTMILGPWLPRNFFVDNAQLADRANPFRGRRTPYRIVDLGELSGATTPAELRTELERYTVLDLENAGPGVFDPATDCDFGGGVSGPCTKALGGPGNPLDYEADPVSAVIRSLVDISQVAGDKGFTFNVIGLGAGTMLGPYPNFALGADFGGDFSGIVPCVEPTNKTNIAPLDFNQQLSGNLLTQDCIPFTNISAKGGIGELPLRPAPQRSHLLSVIPNTAQGLYIPSQGLIREMAGSDFDEHEFNINEWERAFNRGASQRDTYEIKEAFADMEFFDSRLWVRGGLQNIVYGKTELFRTTDQFNPQDFGLASLPSLEESRIALLSGRAVWSFYDVGPLEDVRLEVAANFDRIQPADLGACGEPFVFDLICQVTLGLAFHSLVGIGLAGVDRPPDGTEDIDGVEFGGRVEFRWDRFSVAIVDFYGYNDFPYPDPIFFYERNVDPYTGRPRRANDYGPCENAAAYVADVDLSDELDPRVIHAGNSRIEFSDGLGDPALRADVRPTGEGTPDSAIDDYHRRPESYTVLGVGTDPSCLKPGGPAGTPGENRFDPSLTVADVDAFLAAGGRYSTGGDLDPNLPISDPSVWTINTLVPDAANESADNLDGLRAGQWQLAGSSVDFALVDHHANQQLFAFICSATIGIAAALAPSECAWSVFGSGFQLLEGITPSFAEVISAYLGGDRPQFMRGITTSIVVATKGGGAFFDVPVSSLNRDVRDGRTTATSPAINPGAGFTGDNITSATSFRDSRDITTLDNALTVEQKALIGCGPFFGTRCDTAALEIPGTFGPQEGDKLNGIFLYAEGGGIDFLNSEGSAIAQSMPGVEGSLEGFTPFVSQPLIDNFTMLQRGIGGFPDDGFIDKPVTWSRLDQPGTINYDNDVVCTRFMPGSDRADATGLVKLPGCRGAESYEIVDDVGVQQVRVVFEDFYTPRQDGCVFGPTVSANGDTFAVVAWDPDADAPDSELQAELEATCFYTDFNPNDPNDTTQISLRSLHREGVGTSNPVAGARTLYHPLAGCEDSPVFATSTVSFLCPYNSRNFDQEFYDGSAQVFRSEMAAWSWNFLTFLVITSCNVNTGDNLTDGECFDQSKPFAIGRCSFSQPYRCTNVQGFLSVIGTSANDVRAGGNSRFGRRDFIWHSGGEAVLRYQRRNVFGVSADFAEDVSKTNWGVEFTWIGEVPFVDFGSESFISDSQALNLTISVDRPTFINFLNPNRTFFFNTQWFFQYLPEHENTFASNGPFNTLFIFAFFTGYFQDRLMPLMVTVYDFNSESGGMLPQISYRFTEAFSITFGVSFFFGQTELRPMAVRSLGPVTNRASPNQYKDSVDNLLSLFRRRDEAFMRVRMTF